MRPFSVASSSQYGRQQRIWLDGGGGGDGGGEGGEVAVVDGGDAAAGSGGSGVLIEKEHMFDKVVTPSDVGKLNRLVIPKQHAEKYFPLDSSNNEKGLLLNFEDRNGKPWRFRYSYWNSSQSYVMTKGWSRFVKEKKLDAGDIVSFQRGAAESFRDRLFIDWRRRPDSAVADHHRHNHHHLTSIPAVSLHHHLSLQRSHQHHYPWNNHHHNNNHQLLSPPTQLPPQPYGYSYGIGSPHNTAIFGGGAVVVNGNPCSSSATTYFRPMSSSAASAAAAAANHRYQQEIMMQRRIGGGGEGAMVFESFPVVQGKAAAKRLRLFGVNMDCPIPDSHENDVVLSPSPSSSSTAAANSSSIATSLQLRPYSYGDDELFQAPDNKPNKSSSSSMSLDLDI